MTTEPVQALQSADPTVRRKACYNLAKSKDESAVDPLITALSGDEDATVRGAAAFALGEVGSARAVDALIQALNDHEGNVESGAATALGKIGDVRAVPDLSELAKAKNRAAIVALGKIGDARAIPSLLEVMLNTKARLDRFSVEVIEAITAIGGSPAAEAFLAALHDRNMFKFNYELTAGLVEVGEPAVSLLIASLSDDNQEIRAAAAIALGGIEDARAVQPLVAALEDPAARVRRSAADALNRIGTPEAAAALEGYAKGKGRAAS